MPTSKKRGGKKKHRKRVQNRNQDIQAEKNRRRKYEREMYDQLIKQYEATQKEKENKDSSDSIEGIDAPEI